MKIRCKTLYLILLLIIGSSTFIPKEIFARKKKNKVKFRMLSRPEKWWVIAHPFVAKKAGIIAIKVKKSAKKVEEEGKLGSDYLGGRMDAFRHSYWMAMLAQDINPEKVKKLGEAHEKGNYLDFKKRRHEDGAVPDSMATVMDLWNNDVGIRIGTENKKLSREKLIAVVVAAIFEGEMKMMKKNDEKTYLDQDGNEIDLKDFDRQWRNPKCLVSTK